MGEVGVWVVTLRDKDSSLTRLRVSSVKCRDLRFAYGRTSYIDPFTSIVFPSCRIALSLRGEIAPVFVHFTTCHSF